MSFTVEMPIDKESAKQLLGKFMENATNKRYMKEFKKAVEIMYGAEFDVKLDLSNRMCFSCEVCHKDMNNVKSLIEHSISGSHLKSKDSIYHGSHIRSLPCKTGVPSKNLTPLTRKIKESAVKIIGLQYVEAYDNGRGRFYYKCNLCGAHGKADTLYYHLIGDKHTDKYIKIRVQLNSVVYGPTERAELRVEITKREMFTINDIAVIKGKSLYPYKWEIDGGGRAKPKNKNKEFDFDLLNKRIHMEPVPRTPSLQERDFMTYQYFENILLKFNVIVQIHFNNASDVLNPKDLRFAMCLHFYVMHVLFYIFRCFKHRCESPRRLEFLDDQDTHITKAMGCLRLKLCEQYTKKHSKTYGDLPVALGGKHK